MITRSDAVALLKVADNGEDILAALDLITQVADLPGTDNN
jgi:hypothetical protein